MCRHVSQVLIRLILQTQKAAQRKMKWPITMKAFLLKDKNVINVTIEYIIAGMQYAWYCPYQNTFEASPYHIMSVK